MSLQETQAEREANIAWVKSILDGNNGKRSIQRILFPDRAPVMPWGEDDVATHQMEWGEADGNYYVYPRLMEDAEGKLQDYGDGAMDEAMRRRDFITFKTPEEADRFSRFYKLYWDLIGFKPKRRRELVK